RKMMLVLGMLLSAPACLVAAFAPSAEMACWGPLARRRRGRHGFPDDSRADHGAVVGTGAHEVNRSVVRHRRRDRLARPTNVGLAARAFLVGLGVPNHFVRCRS